jgi:Fe-S-cluster-containing dehydrogenase component
VNTAVERRPFPVARLSDGKSRAILFDAAKCIGCRQCVEACKDWNDLPRGNTYKIGRSTWLNIEPPVLEGTVSVWGHKSCMHCQYPLCAAVCPVEAITKYEEGPVVIDQAACIGCEYCIHACPWQVISKDEITHKAMKCTMCHDRIAAGTTPFCVQSCPVGALEFGLLEEIEPRVAHRANETGAIAYGRQEAGGTQVLHILTAAPREHGNPAVVPCRYPGYSIPFWKMARVLISHAGGIDGKWRAIKNAVCKPWRLKYRYWHRGAGAGRTRSLP